MHQRLKQYYCDPNSSRKDDETCACRSALFDVDCGLLCFQFSMSIVVHFDTGIFCSGSENREQTFYILHPAMSNVKSNATFAKDYRYIISTSLTFYQSHKILSIARSYYHWTTKVCRLQTPFHHDLSWYSITSKSLYSKV